MVDSKSPIKPIGQVFAEVEAQLQPLFADFYPTSKQYRAFLDDSMRFTKLLAKAGITSSTIQQTYATLESGAKLIQENTNVDPREIAKAERVLEALTYLSFVELLATPYIDLAILMLISNEHALHLAPDQKHPYVRHASSMKDLDSPALSLYAKLDFLDMNGFPFFSKWVDRPLRNKIAHLDFHIDNEGVFFIENENGTREKVDLKAKLNSFAQYDYAVIDYISNEIAKCTHKPPARRTD
jgi:hypothetical protein